MSPLRKAFRVAGGCFLVFVLLFFIVPILLIAYRDANREKACNQALSSRVARGATLRDNDVTFSPLTLDALRTDELWLNWPSYAGDISAHITAGGHARVEWTDSDTIGVLFYGADGRALRHVCFVT